MLSNSEILLDHVFRVWIGGQGHDYHVVLTPVSLLLQPTNSDPDQLSPPICCICPARRGDRGCFGKGPCGAKQLEILGRDIISCYPANHSQGQSEVNKKKKKQKSLDPKVTGYPVFMIVSYPPNKKGKRKRMQLHFHLMQKPGPNEGTAGNVEGDAVFTDKETKKLSKERLMTMNAAKIRDTWVHAITTSLFTDDASRNTADYNNTQRRLLVVINPFSGRKRALTVATHTVLPILHQAGMEYEILLTQCPGHAQQVMRQEASDRWRGIVTVSGDGTVFEVLNGLFERPDWREALDSLPLCIVPGGTGNGISRSLIHTQKELFNEASQAVSCSVNAAKAGIQHMDMMYVETPHMAKACLHSVYYGFVADVDIDSEVLRSIGELRFYLTSLWKIAKKRVYRARLSYIPLSVDTVDDGSSSAEQGHDNKVFEQDLDRRADTQNIIRELRQSQEDLDQSSDEDDAAAAKSNLDQSDQPTASANSQQNAEESSEIQVSEDSESERDGGGAVELVENPPIQPPGTYLVPKQVSYGTMLAQGQLYFRSWQELQSRVLRRHPPPVEHLPLHETASSAGGGGRSVSGAMGGPPPLQLVVPPPPAPPPVQAILTPQPPAAPCPKHGYKVPMFIQKQAVANACKYSTAAAAMKRGEDSSRPYFEDLPPLSEEILPKKASNVSLVSSDDSSKNNSSRWVVESSTYVGVCLVNVPFLSQDGPLAPDAKLDDGALHLVIMRGQLSRSQMTQILIKLEKGTHVNTPGLEIIPVQAARIEPLPSNQHMGKMCLDGELIDTTPLQAHVMPKAVKLFTK